MWSDQAWDLINYLASRLNTVRIPCGSRTAIVIPGSRVFVSDAEGNRAIHTHGRGGRGWTSDGIEDLPVPQGFNLDKTERDRAGILSRRRKYLAFLDLDRQEMWFRRGRCRILRY